MGLFSFLLVFGMMVVAKWHLKFSVVWRIHCLFLRSFHLVVDSLQVISHRHQTNLNMILQRNNILGLRHFINCIYLLYHAVYALYTLNVRLTEFFFTAAQIVHIDIFEAVWILCNINWRHLLRVFYADLHVFRFLCIFHLVIYGMGMAQWICNCVFFNVFGSYMLWIVGFCVQLSQRFFAKPRCLGHKVGRAALAAVCWAWHWSQRPISAVIRPSLAPFLAHWDWLWIISWWSVVYRVLLIRVNQIFALQVQTTGIICLRIWWIGVRVHMWSLQLLKRRRNAWWIRRRRSLRDGPQRLLLLCLVYTEWLICALHDNILYTDEIIAKWWLAIFDLWNYSIKLVFLWLFILILLHDQLAGSSIDSYVGIGVMLR